MCVRGWRGQQRTRYGICITRCLHYCSILKVPGKHFMELQYGRRKVGRGRRTRVWGRFHAEKNGQMRDNTTNLAVMLSAIIVKDK